MIAGGNTWGVMSRPWARVVLGSKDGGDDDDDDDDNDDHDGDDDDDDGHDDGDIFEKQSCLNVGKSNS